MELKVKVDTHVLAASTIKVTVDFLRELINSGRKRDIYNITESIGRQTWKDMEYTPVPSSTKTLRGTAGPRIEYITPKVILTLRDILIQASGQSHISGIGLPEGCCS